MSLLASSTPLVRSHASMLRPKIGGSSSARLLVGPQRRQPGRCRQQQTTATLAADASVAVVEAVGQLAEAFEQPAADSALAAAQAAAESDPTDLVFTVLFTIAIAALSVVTLGVAYLSFTSWNDSRLEAADRARFDTSTYRASSSSTSPAKKSAKAAAKAAAKTAVKEPEEFKGFGKK